MHYTLYNFNRKKGYPRMGCGREINGSISLGLIRFWSFETIFLAISFFHFTHVPHLSRVAAYREIFSKFHECRIKVYIAIYEFIASHKFVSRKCIVAIPLSMWVAFGKQQKNGDHFTILQKYLIRYLINIWYISHNNSGRVEILLWAKAGPGLAKVGPGLIF